jgi:phthalate 4,5-dioxygenase oxygenase subunit
MTTTSENKLLTQVGPEAPMGDLMRQYWFPVARSDEIAADGAPVRLMALGEKLIAFRDSSGRAGVMDHRCPHRCASLFFGRNEEDGIRCVYHGWKFDVDGNCLDMANVPDHQDFKAKVKAKAYPAQDRWGAIWIYMGDRDTPPPFPDFEINDLGDSEIIVRMVQQEYNWLQGLENDLDTSHFGFLHLGGIDPETMDQSELLYQLAIDRAPQFHIEETPMGLMYGAYRPADAGNTHWRMAQFMAPFWVIPPAGPADRIMGMKGYIPMDDTHTMPAASNPARRSPASAERAIEVSWNFAKTPLNGWDDGGWSMRRRTITLSTASCSGTAASIAASMACRFRTTPSPAPWGQSPTAPSSIWLPATK